MGVCLVACALWTSIAVADDLQPPWWRGEYSTTSQMWEFNSTVGPGQPVPPDGPAPGGMDPLPSTELVWTPGASPWDQWLPEDEGRVGVLPLSGALDVIVDNHEPPNEYKWVWLQLTWRPQCIQATPMFENLDPAPVEPPSLVEVLPLENGWMESTYAWEIRPNPEFESFTVLGSINVDEMIIDTWCIPEPTTVSLLALGSMVLFRRRRS